MWTVIKRPAALTTSAKDHRAPTEHFTHANHGDFLRVALNHYSLDPGLIGSFVGPADMAQVHITCEGKTAEYFGCS